MNWRLFFFFILLSISFTANGQVLEERAKEYAINEVNKIRSEGRKCGRKYFPAVPPVIWDDKLYLSAKSHANDMNENDYFSHNSVKGYPFNKRFDDVGYVWIEIGENIAEGQRSLKEVLADWVKSSEHCSLIMSNKFRDVAIARKGKYWVQHFGKKIPKGAVKKGGRIYLKK